MEMTFDQHKDRLLRCYAEQQFLLSGPCFYFNFIEPKAREKRGVSLLVLGPGLGRLALRGGC